jgi:hypothetical protein
LVDVNGQAISSVHVGQQAVVQIVLDNAIDSNLPFAVLIEIRNGQGITEYLAWYSGSVDANGTYKFETSWMPSNGCLGSDIDWRCTYEIRTFAVSNLTNPQVLDAVEMAQIAVLGADERYKVYELMIDGREYGMTYSLDNGSITNIKYEPAIATVLVELNLVGESELVIKLPNEIIFDSINCAVHPSDLDAEVFADTIPVSEVQQASTTASRLLQIQLPAGTEVVEIVGGCPLS